jgi:tetratricopeptide (TPR) repeat protein
VVQETVANSYLLTREFATARIHASKAIELYRYNAHFYLTLAKIEDRLGNLTEALKNYEMFVAFGVMEYPDEVATVRNYLPVLRTRIAWLEKRG